MSSFRASGALLWSALFLLAFAAPARADFVVDSALDAPDAAIDADCDTGTGECTLRAAIEESNATPEADVITFTGGGTYTLSAQIPISEPLALDGNGSGVEAADTVIDGGGVTRIFDVSAGAVTLKDVRLQNGSLDVPTLTADGGGAVRTAADLILSSAVLSANEVTGLGDGSGGAIESTGPSATVTVVDSTVSGNEISAVGAGTNAGGAISAAGSVTLTGSWVAGNEISAGTSTRGGGIAVAEGLSVNRSTVSGNSITAGASTEGGGIYNGSGVGSRSIVNSTISGNSVTGTDGAGGVQIGADASVTNATFAANSGGPVDGGADLIAYGAPATVTVKNTILSSANACKALSAPDAVISSAGHNIDAGTSCGLAGPGDMPGTDPELTGLTPFTPLPPMHLTLFGSPAIDAAESTCGGGLGTDQRGLERPQGNVCDIGAFERNYRQLTVSRTGSGFGMVTGTGVSCGPDCSASAVDGATLVLTATPAAGSDFGSWSGACSSVAGTQCTVDLGNDRMVSASFVPEPAQPPPGGNGPPPKTKKKCKKGKKLVKGKCKKKRRRRI